MASLALGAVGAYLAPAGYAALGYTVGSTIGALASQKSVNIAGPTLSDLSANFSSFGAPIPIVYGTSSVMGNIFWSTDKIPTTTTSTQGGKGGPSQTTTTTTYRASFAVALCEGEVDSIRKIWANGKLIYDVSPGTSGENVIASALLSGESATALGPGMVVYLGTTTQQPDSTLEGYLGSGNVPGYRGICYLVFNDFQLGDYGNNIPQISAEVVTSATFAVEKFSPTVRLTYTDGDTEPGYAGWLPTGECALMQRTSGGFGTMSYFTNYALSTTSYRKLGGISFSTVRSPVYARHTDLPGIMQPLSDDMTQFVFYGLDGNNKFFTAPETAGVSCHSYFGAGSPYRFCKYKEHIVFVSDYIRTGVAGALAICWDFYTGEHKWTHTGATGTNITFGVNSSYYMYHPSSSSNVIFLNISDGTVAITAGGIGYNSGNTISVDDDIFWQYTGGGGGAALSYWDFNISNWVVTHIGSAVFTEIAATCHAQKSGNVLRVHVQKTISGVNKKQVYVFNLTAPTSAGATTGAIVSDLCGRVGLTNIDTSALTDTVDGYVVSKQLTVRSAIDVLRDAYGFDAVVDQSLKFVPRTTTSGVTLDEEQLGAGENEPANHLLTLERTQDVELPNRMYVNFLDRTSNYEQNTAIATRFTGNSDYNETLDLSSLSITPDNAAKIADVKLFEIWEGRNRVNFSLGYAYLHIEPTDVVSLTYNGIPYNLRITSTKVKDGRIDFSATQNTVQTSYAVGAGRAETVVSIFPTYPSVDLLDIPMLRSSDSSGGFYVALSNPAAAYIGGTFSYSRTQDSGYSVGGVTSETAVTGTATTALAAAPSLGCTDEKSSVDVEILTGTVSSITNDELLQMQNLAALGSEIIAFRDVTLVSGTTYRLSGLLRGLYGTDIYAGTHAINDRFVLLRGGAGILNVSTVLEESIYYVASPNGKSSPLSGVLFTNTCARLRPYAPTHLRLGSDGASGRVLTWMNRTRIPQESYTYSTHPLGEETEYYVIRIYTTSAFTTVKRTLYSTTSSVTYTSAMVTEDFGSMPATLYWEVAQISSAVGEGFATRKTSTT